MPPRPIHQRWFERSTPDFSVNARSSMHQRGATMSHAQHTSAAPRPRTSSRDLLGPSGCRYVPRTKVADGFVWQMRVEVGILCSIHMKPKSFRPQLEKEGRTVYILHSMASQKAQWWEMQADQRSACRLKTRASRAELRASCDVVDGSLAPDSMVVFAATCSASYGRSHTHSHTDMLSPCDSSTLRYHVTRPCRTIDPLA